MYPGTRWGTVGSGVLDAPAREVVTGAAARPAEWPHGGIDLVEVQANEFRAELVAGESTIRDHLAHGALSDAEVLGGVGD